MFYDLNDENFQMFAMKNYSNPHCTDILEFHDDLKRIRYVKRLFKRYKDTGELKERLILNHLMILYNTFETKAMTRMLFLKLDSYLDCLKPFLILMGYWPTDLGLVKGKQVLDSDINLDTSIVEVLRNI